MSLETFAYIKDLVASNPTATDPKNQGDDHLRGIKETLKQQFSGFTLGKPILLNEDELNNLKGQGGKQVLCWAPANALLLPATNPASDAELVSTSGAIRKVLDFGFTVAQGCQLPPIKLPENWNQLTFSARPIWESTVATGSCVWGFKALVVGDGQNPNTAFGTQVLVTDATAGAGLTMVGPESAAITPGGVRAENQMLFLTVTREPLNAGDTINDAACRLVGVELFYTLKGEVIP
jgi:hypothetical protein